MGQWVGGGFADLGFSPVGFNTGAYVEDNVGGVSAIYNKDKLILKDDDEILTVLVNATISGLLDDST